MQRAERQTSRLDYINLRRRFENFCGYFAAASAAEGLKNEHLLSLKRKQKRFNREIIEFFKITKFSKEKSAYR